jgi:Na+-translocating ferredoxin:NAD+ oxidoreductase RnfD subunit
MMPGWFRWVLVLPLGVLAALIEFSQRRALNWHVAVAFLAGTLVGLFLTRKGGR